MWEWRDSAQYRSPLLARSTPEKADPLDELEATVRATSAARTR
jgi:hypothetical protein